MWMRIGLTLGLLAALGCSTAATDPVERAQMQQELSAIADSLKLPRAYNLIHELVGPSVVSIHTRERRAIARWGRIVETREMDVGEGSGFVFHTDDEGSYIVTNAHVVVRTNQRQEFIRTGTANQPVWYDTIQIKTHDERMLTAEPVGADLQSDLALLKVLDVNLQPITWGDSDAVHVGDHVLALGYPLGVGYSATGGIVSATGRNTGIYGEERGYESFIQTDASINPGNSGGPLMDMHGTVIGVNANIVSRTGGSVGLGFAIPSNLARRVAEDLLDDGRIARPMVGIWMDELKPLEAEQLGIANRQAVRITLVMPRSPAETAGLQDNDIITAIGGADLQGIQQFRSRIASTRPGDGVPFTVWRDGKLLELTVRPVTEEELHRNVDQAFAADESRIARLPNYGLMLIDDGLRGAKIHHVEPGSVAARAGLQAGDRIMRVYEVGQVTEVKPLEQLDKRRELVADVYRNGSLLTFRLRQ